jgi:hypothetical protein
MSSGANRWLVRLRDSGRVHPNPVFQQSYAFIVKAGVCDRRNARELHPTRVLLQS